MWNLVTFSRQKKKWKNKCWNGIDRTLFLRHSHRTKPKKTKLLICVLFLMCLIFFQSLAMLPFLECNCNLVHRCCKTMVRYCLIFSGSMDDNKVRFINGSSFTLEFIWTETSKNEFTTYSLSAIPRSGKNVIFKWIEMKMQNFFCLVFLLFIFFLMYFSKNSVIQ